MTELNTATSHLDQLCLEIPEHEDILKEALLLQLRTTRAAALLLDCELTNMNTIKLMGEQVAKLLSVVSAVKNLSKESSEAETINTSFSFENTNYKPVQVDDDGVPIEETP